MVESKTWVLARHFEGFPEDSNFELKLEQLPEPKDGGNDCEGLICTITEVIWTCTCTEYNIPVPD